MRHKSQPSLFISASLRRGRLPATPHTTWPIAVRVIPKPVRYIGTNIRAFEAGKNYNRQEYHKKSNIKSSKSVTCNDFKREISNFEKGGYHPLKFITKFQDAALNSRSNDSDVNHLMPKKKETKVYLLAEAIINEVPNSDIVEFINVTVPELIKAELAKQKPDR